MGNACVPEVIQAHEALDVDDIAEVMCPSKDEKLSPWPAPAAEVTERAQMEFEDAEIHGGQQDEFPLWNELTLTSPKPSEMLTGYGGLTEGGCVGGCSRSPSKDCAEVGFDAATVGEAAPAGDAGRSRSLCRSVGYDEEDGREPTDALEEDEEAENKTNEGKPQRTAEEEQRAKEALVAKRKAAAQKKRATEKAKKEEERKRAEKRQAEVERMNAEALREAEAKQKAIEEAKRKASEQAMLKRKEDEELRRRNGETNGDKAVPRPSSRQSIRMASGGNRAPMSWNRKSRSSTRGK
eukprot:TRINITY_DN32005_c0_g1_i2.p1 TRINITY_DN32005_c0_g1~~TRINITY_DN32005_c0_g1_i2.p1  ORF type:complete len:295 (-),score=83.98 TRINITY_DN32005_c0_g1_i2:41-925(-)